MKKKIIIPVISCFLVFIYGNAQELKEPDSAKKKYTCFIKIKTAGNVTIEAALERFTADTVFIALLGDNYVKAGGEFIKILTEDPEWGIAADQIDSFQINYDPNIVYAGELQKKKKELKGKNAGRIFGMVLSGVITAPVALYGGSPLIIDAKDFSGIGKRETSVSGSNLYVSKREKTFQLNGDKEKYLKMIQRLTKSKTNPFENSIAKNE